MGDSKKQWGGHRKDAGRKPKYTGTVSRRVAIHLPEKAWRIYDQMVADSEGKENVQSIFSKVLADHADRLEPSKDDQENE